MAKDNVLYTIEWLRCARFSFFFLVIACQLNVSSERDLDPIIKAPCFFINVIIIPALCAHQSLCLTMRQQRSATVLTLRIKRGVSSPFALLLGLRFCYSFHFTHPLNVKMQKNKQTKNSNALFFFFLFSFKQSLQIRMLVKYASFSLPPFCLPVFFFCKTRTRTSALRLFTQVS